MNPAPEEKPKLAAPQPLLTPSYVPASRETSRVMTSVRSPEPHLGWFSRGYLPHWDHPGMMQSLTFRLHDALPLDLVARWKIELGLVVEVAKRRKQHAGKDAGAPRPGSPAPASATPGSAAIPGGDEMNWREAELRKRIARYEDQGHGACYLRQSAIGQLVEQALLHFDGQRYRLLAWCVMPNHVHVLVETKQGFPLPELLHSWKSYTANEANNILRRKAEFWQREYMDRYIRNAEHFTNAIRYIDGNAARAGLVKHPADWPLTSARYRLAPPLGAPALGAPASLPASSPQDHNASKDAGAPRKSFEHQSHQQKS
jgi:REP element-mobilizing transposase RayT